MTKKPTAELITEYFTLQTELYERFGYREDYVVIPIDDRTDMHWMLVGSEGAGGHCAWSPEPFNDEMIKSGNFYSGPIYTQRFLPKWVYRTPTHVMVSVDTQTDGNKFLMIFDAKLECTNEALRMAYRLEWK